MKQRGTLVDRAVARVWLFVRDNEIEELKFNRALRTVPGAVEQRAAIVDRLQQFGVEVVDAVADLRPAAVSDVETRGLARTVPAESVVLEAEPAEPSEDHEESAVDAARAVLRYDKMWGPRPKRILTAVEEVGLVTLMRDGRGLEEELVNGFRKELVDGSEAAASFDSLVIHNIRLVYKIANAHVGRVSPLGTVLDSDDLAQAGMVGLIRAVELFDASRGLKFSTYATNWIRQSIGREIDNTSRLIRVPVHVMEEIRSMWSAVDKLQTSGRRVNHESIGELAGLDTTKVTRYLEYSQTPASLDQTVGEEDSTPLYAFLPSALESGPEYAAMAWSDSVELSQILSTLDSRSAQVLKLRAGIGGDEPKTLDEIGVVFGVTRERIRQIEAKALKALRNGPFARDLRRMVGRVHVVASESGFNPGPRAASVADTPPTTMRCVSGNC